MPIRNSRRFISATVLSFVLLITLLLTSCSATMIPSDEPSFLSGTWKQTKAEQYEVWEKISVYRYEGYAYKLQDGEKKTWEHLVVSKADGQWQLSARVPDQNEGEAIVFKLTSDPSVNNEWLFENAEHDFPKKILYKKLSAEEWFADVRGAEGRGFSLSLLKVE